MTTIDHQQAVEAVQGAILGINVLTAERALTAATPHLRAAWEQSIRELHRPIEIEPSDTICGECSFRLPNGTYFGKVVDWPCPTLALLEGGGEDK